MSDEIAFQHELDARGLRCPEPVMMLHMRLRKMSPGDVVRIVATDPSTTRDIPQLCEHLGHGLLGEFAQGEEYVFFVCKKT